MATFQELVDEVNTLLIDTPPAIVTLVPRFVNRAIRKLEDKHNFLVMRKRFDVTTVVAVPATHTLATRPSDWKAWMETEGPYYTSQLGSRMPITVSPTKAEVLKVRGTEDEGDPKWIFETEEDDMGVADFEIWPLPDGNSDFSDGEYRITIPYWRYLPSLVASPGSSNWFTVNCEEYVIHTAAEIGFATNEDEKRAAYWKGQADLAYVTVLSTDKRKALQGIRDFVPHTGARGPFLTR